MIKTINFSSNYLRSRITFSIGGNVWDVTSFYLAVVSKLIMISWFIIMLTEMCLRRSLLTIQTLVRYESIKLHLLSIHMIINYITQKSLLIISCLMLRPELEDLVMILLLNVVFLRKIVPSHIENEKPVKNSR